MELDKRLSVEENVAEEKVCIIESRTCCQRLRNIISNITVEPVFALYVLPSMMCNIAVQNLTVEKACRVNLNLDKNVCDGISTRNTSMYNTSDEVSVQKFVAQLYVWKNIILSLIPAILLLFVGSFSDRHERRKPFIIIPIIGIVVASSCYLICTYFFEELSSEFVVLSEAIPQSITGGWFTIHTAVYSYIGTITSVEDRIIRIGTLTTFLYINYTIGLALSGLAYLTVGYYGVFSIALAMEVLGVAYAFIVIKEIPRTNTDRDTVPKKNICKDFFDLTNVSETLKVAFAKGKRDRSTKVCLIMILAIITSGPQYGEHVVLYLYTRFKFHWTEFQFSAFSTYNAVVITIATITSLSIFSKRLKLDDSLIGVISCLSKVLSASIYAFAPNTYIFYLGTIAECLVGTSEVALKSLMSKLVPPEELGKIYSLFGICESIMPIIYAPMYSLIYKWTVNVLPGTFYLVGAFFTLPSILIFLWLYTEYKKDQKKLNENEPAKEELLDQTKTNS